MIVDLEKFIRAESRYWDELDAMITPFEQSPKRTLDLNEARRLYYLYERASASLARLNTFSADDTARQRLEDLVARSYAVIHSAGRGRRRFRPLRWFFGTFPRTFRRHAAAFFLAAAVTAGGALFGAGAMILDEDAKEVIMPFGHLLGDPSARVQREEAAETDELHGRRSAFAGLLMTHNTRVSIMVMALGLTFGIGTMALVFYNGVILGAVVCDYIAAGEGTFLAGWLLPHGSVEIPAFLLAAQAGLVIASVLVGWGNRLPLKARVREAAPDVVTLIFGTALLLVWAGIVEAFLSQYHEPVIPYRLKIAFGAAQLVLLAAFLGLCGRGGEDRA